MSFLANNVRGLRNPNGSNIRASSERMFLFVHSSLGAKMLNVETSSMEFHCKPNTFTEEVLSNLGMLTWWNFQERVTLGDYYSICGVQTLPCREERSVEISEQGLFRRIYN
ncbi:hypothetical protein JTB14_013767 [Gonioctena quinquepunctata]|nr:hypothetical protein JTB14_013767 [Gonioctena quinquepunctata]